MATGTYYLIYPKSGIIDQGTKKNFDSRIPVEQVGVVAFIQNEKPANSFPYWKVEGGKVVDMTESEAMYYDLIKEYKRIERDEFLGFDYRIEVSLDYAVGNSNIQPREITRILTDKNTIKESVEVNGVDMLFLYFNTPRAQDAELLSDPNIHFFVLSSYYPNA